VIRYELIRDCGVDKVVIPSAGTLGEDVATKYGNQAVVYDVSYHGDAVFYDVPDWAGEIMLTSIDRDGARDGYDLELTRAIVHAVSVPVIASGGAGNASHVCDAILAGEADAALVAGILHDGVTSIAALKGAMRDATIPVRQVAA
jgi:imidazole glycerol phosphate synthase subunit HisF